jgi:membrane fusion protein, heavy metal efflux system
MNAKIRRGLLVCGAILLTASCGQRKETPATAAAAQSAEADRTFQQYRVETVTERSVPLNVVSAPGKIEANSSRISRVLPPVAGRITQVLVKFGDSVTEKQPLAILESADADTAVSNVLQAEAAVNQANASLTKADADLDRLRDLYDNKAIARKELLQAENQQAQAKGSVKQAEALLRQALRRLDFLELKKDQFGQKIVVRAPIPGKVLEVNVAPGEFRNDPNSPLMTIADLSTVWVTADVPESAIRFIHRGERIETELTAYPGEVFPGRVTQIADVVDPQTRAIKVRGELDNHDGRLRPEMFGQVRHIDSVRRVPCVPFAAVVQVQGRSVVFVETASGTYDRRDVTLGERIGNLVPVLTGLRAGEKVVVDGALVMKRS